jgi:hypothetical protein
MINSFLTSCCGIIPIISSPMRGDHAKREAWESLAYVGD